MSRSLAPALLAFAACPLLQAGAQEVKITSVRKTENHTVELDLRLPADRYAVLYRSFHLNGSGEQPLALARGTGDIVTLRDTAPFARRGFLRAKLFDIASPGDSDGDGIDDLTEHASPFSLNPFNPAQAIDAMDGAVHLPDRGTFDLISHRDTFPGATNIREVKFLLTSLQEGEPKLHFLDVGVHAHHFDFAKDVLGLYTSLSVFNDETYFTNANRHNFAGSLIAHDNYVWPDGRLGIYTIESWPTDAASFEYIQIAFEMTAAAAPFLDGKLAYHPSSETQRALHRNEIDLYRTSHIPIIDTGELFGNQTYNALHPGEAFGRLKVAKPGETLTARDIVIFTNIPNDVTHLAGIITEIPQTPLSHINLKARQNDTPNAYLQAASTHPDIAPFLGQDVRLEIGPDALHIRAATQAEVDAHFESIRPSVAQLPVRDLSANTIEPLGNIGFEHAGAFGSKAANVAELRKVLPEIAPNGFAIPFYFYDQFMIHNGFYAVAEAMMADPLFQGAPAIREARLAAFRDQIEHGSVLPTWMKTALGDMQSSFPANIPLRSRSSTNNEDLEGFNGAGLYDSYTHHPDEGHFAKTAKQVWAGLWTYRAFEERDFWRIDHFTAAMGILVHPNFSDERVNGVGVTTNPYAPNPFWDGHYVNVQLGESLVTNPDANTTPEEYTIAYLGGAVDFEIQYVRFSSLVPDGETVLSREQAIELNGAMNTIDDHFKGKYGDPQLAMELEFKIDASGALFIKQVRPWVE